MNHRCETTQRSGPRLLGDGRRPLRITVSPTRSSRTTTRCAARHSSTSHKYSALTMSQLSPKRARCRYSTNGSDRTITVAMSRKTFNTVTSCRGSRKHAHPSVQLTHQSRSRSGGISGQRPNASQPPGERSRRIGMTSMAASDGCGGGQVVALGDAALGDAPTHRNSNRAPHHHHHEIGNESGKPRVDAANVPAEHVEFVGR